MDQHVIDSTSNISARKRFERLYSAIRRRICMLDYPPGMRLSEEAMAREFGVSRTPLRRVLGRLETEGLVQSVHGVGTMVTAPSIDELLQVFRMRLELADLAGTLDPRQPTEAEMAEFAALEARSKALVDNPEPRAFSTLNLDFFHAHLALIGNPPLRDITEQLFYRTARIWQQSVSDARLDLSDEVRIFNREIEDVVAALKIGDLKAAAMINRAHISMSIARMQNVSAQVKPTERNR